MKRLVTALLLVMVIPALAQAPTGKWTDTTKDYSGVFFFGDHQSLLLREDYEVLSTHEVCASVTGFFLEHAEQGRYDVNFKGMRTTATFTFTTRYDAENWVKKFCTPESLLQIKNGHANLARSY